MGKLVGAVAFLTLFPVLVVVLAVGAMNPPSAAAQPGAVRPGVIPAAYAGLVQAAAGTCPLLTPALLAAQIEVESGWQPTAVSPAGARGIAQIMPDTWRVYGGDGNGDGSKDVMDPADAIPAMGRIDCANAAAVAGVGGDPLATMLAAYDAGTAAVEQAGGIPAIPETQAYVQKILALTQSDAAPAPAAGGGGPPGAVNTAVNTAGYALPLDARYLASGLGRTDEGVDIEGAPVGATVYSMCPGVVTLIGANGPLGVGWGFGPNYPIIRCTAGSLAGQAIYYGHVGVSLVAAGHSVTAGQPIATLTHIDGAGGPTDGHIEIGFDTGSGVPTNQGPAMRAFLIPLGASFGLALS